MPGNCYLLDTNIVIYALNQRLTLPDGHYGVSIITEMELLSYPKLTDQEEGQIHRLLREFLRFALCDPVKQLAIDIRRTTALKLPDSIISATAIEHQFALVTDDGKLSEHHPGTAISLEELVG